MDRVLLIDALNFIWRGNLAKETLTGDFVIAFNFFRNLRPIIEQFSPNKCFFVLEGRPHFRYALYPEYKANRLIKLGAVQNNIDKVIAAKEIIVKVLQHLPITICRAPNYECDDVIGSLSHDMRNEDITIVSNDSDFIQLLQRGYKNIQIYNPFNKTFMRSPIYSYVCWKSLRGDKKSDNINGLVSDAKAAKLAIDPKLLQQFLSIEENRANFSINRQLIELAKVPMEELIITEGIFNSNLLKEEFRKMEFKSIIDKLETWNKYINTFKCLDL